MDDNCGSVLIVDDDHAMRELLSVLCRQAGYASHAAATSEEALAAATKERPHVVLLDVKLGAASGYQVCRDLRERFGEQLPIIFLSGTRTDSSDRVAGLLLGADDYVTKPFDPEELLARVRRAVARSSSANGGSATGLKRLTPRELEILGLLARGRGTRAISEDLHISPKTVSTHVQRMLVKLKLHSRAEAVALAYHEGVVLNASESRLAPSQA
jgi:two-component system OmpR family response regulator